MKVLKPIIFLLIIVLSFTNCKSKVTPKDPNVETYFSIKQFLDDQWENRKGIPYTLLKISTFNGKMDSSIVGLDSILWQGIRTKFDPADISSTEFLGQYDFNSFEEKEMDLTTLHYQAKNKDLFMQVMNIDIDDFTNRIRSVYIETSKENAIYKKTEKLLFVPDNLIQIQEFEKSMVSPAKNMKISYRFDY